MRWAIIALASVGLLLPLSTTASAAPQTRAEPSTPSCYGAAARDKMHPCRNPALRLAAQPQGSIAALIPNEPCTPLSIHGDYTDRDTGPLIPCSFGAKTPTSPRVVALVGDSHAMALRAAVHGMAVSRGWVAIDMTRSGCPFSFASRQLEDRGEIRGCRTFNRRVIRYLTKNPFIDTIVSVGAAGGSAVRTKPGADQFETRVAGFQDAWQALPASIQHVIAVRDAPRMRNPHTLGSCIRRAQKAERPPGVACAQPRSSSLLRDPAKVAARRLRLARYAAIDLSEFMCDFTRCFPVVGGVLVFKDGHHLTRAFSTSLGPMLARRVALVVRD